jgi:hypothetical protein
MELKSVKEYKRDIRFRQPIYYKDRTFRGWHYWGFDAHFWIGVQDSPEVPARTSQQFTEHVDNKGVEIWDGDRVKVWDAVGKSWTGVVRFIDGCWEVSYDEPQWDRGMELNRTRLYLKCFTINHAIEVIGNIIENPGPEAHI